MRRSRCSCLPMADLHEEFSHSHCRKGQQGSTSHHIQHTDHLFIPAGRATEYLGLRMMHTISFKERAMLRRILLLRACCKVYMLRGRCIGEWKGPPGSPHTEHNLCRYLAGPGGAVSLPELMSSQKSQG